MSLFSRPLTLEDAIDRLEEGASSPTDFVPTLSVINMLIGQGALIPPASPKEDELFLASPGRDRQTPGGVWRPAP